MVRNTKVYKIREICRAISSAFYNISRPNFAILLILSYSDGFRSSCLGGGGGEEEDRGGRRIGGEVLIILTCS